MSYPTQAEGLGKYGNILLYIFFFFTCVPLFIFGLSTAVIYKAFCLDVSLHEWGTQWASNSLVKVW